MANLSISRSLGQSHFWMSQLFGILIAMSQKLLPPGSLGDKAEDWYYVKISPEVVVLLCCFSSTKYMSFQSSHKLLSRTNPSNDANASEKELVMRQRMKHVDSSSSSYCGSPRSRKFGIPLVFELGLFIVVKGFLVVPIFIVNLLNIDTADCRCASDR